MSEQKDLCLGLKIALQRFSEEQDRREAIDTKCSLVLGSTGVLMGLLFDFVSGKSGASPAGISGAPLIVLAIALSAILLAAVLSLMALAAVHQYLAGPGGQILIIAAEKWPETEQHKEFTRAYARAYENNCRRNQLKFWLFLSSTIALALGIALTFLSFVLSLVS